MDENVFRFGPYYSNGIQTDIKKSMITLARYKFVGKMLEREKELKILELGCNEGLGSYFFTQMDNCIRYVGVDLDESAIQWGIENVQSEKFGEKVDFFKADFLEPMNFLGGGGFDAIISLDVIEHIEKSNEQRYMETFIRYLNDDGIAIIGTPNIRMQSYQSEETKKVHVNMFDDTRLYHLCHNLFKNVFIFSMNDEVVHTGFAPMSCYFFALCCGPLK